MTLYMQKIIFTVLIRKLPSLFIILFLSFLTFAGTDCDKIFDPGTPTDITGTWELVGMAGDLQDVCLGEIATFQTNNVAQLRCPNANTINRQYTFENGVLTFTETGISYNVTFRTTNNIQQIVFQGRNVNRTLTYNER
jgi:hypothetical protein